MQSTSRTLWPDVGAGFWLFFALLAVYLLSYSGGFHSIDEVSAMAMTENLAKHGQVTTDQIWWSQNWTPSQGRPGPDGHLYSKKGVGLGLLGVPLYWLALPWPEAGQIRAVMLANAFVTALTGWLVYRCVLLLNYRPSVAILAALGFGLGTMAWPYAKYFFSEPLAGLGLLLGLWGLLATHRSGRAYYALLAGVGLGLTLSAKVIGGATWPLFLAYGVWIAVHPLNRPQAESGIDRTWLVSFAMAFLAPLFISGLALLAYNYVRSGHLLDMGYTPAETFSTPLLEGLTGLLLSPGKSLFVYSPLLLVALLGIPALVRRDAATALLSLGVATTYFIPHALWFMWWGGWSWGPRFLVPIVPLLCLFLAPVLDWVSRPSRRWSVVLLGVVGLLSLGVQVLGVTIDFNQYLLLLYERGIDSAEVNFRVDLLPLVGHWDLLRAGNLDLIWARGLAAGLDWPKLGWLLALLAGALLAWSVARRLGRAGRWVLAAVVVGLLAISMLAVTRLPAPADDWQAGCESLSATLQSADHPGDAMVVDMLPYSSHMGLAVPLLERYKAQPAYWGWAREESPTPERLAVLERLSVGQDHDQLWLALDSTPEADPASATERWFAEHTFPVESRWLSPAMRLVRYHVPAGFVCSQPQSPLDLRLGDQVRLLGYSPACADATNPSASFEVLPGEVLAFTLHWQTEQPIEQDYTVFVQLLDEQGSLRAQIDRLPVAGFRPTSTWEPGSQIRDNYGLELPPDLPPGRYQLIAGLYLPATMERLPVSTADGASVGDYAVLGEVIVAAPSGD